MTFSLFYRKMNWKKNVENKRKQESWLISINLNLNHLTCSESNNQEWEDKGSNHAEGPTKQKASNDRVCNEAKSNSFSCPCNIDLVAAVLCNPSALEKNSYFKSRNHLNSQWNKKLVKIVVQFFMFYYWEDIHEYFFYSCAFGTTLYKYTLWVACIWWN